MQTYVLIVNYRTPDLVVECLASIDAQRSALQGGKVAVVDNASGDNSPQRVRHAIESKGWGEWVEVLEMPRNGGFSYGNNAGMRWAQRLAGSRPHHILLLNPDAILKPHCLAQALAFLDVQPRAGIIGVPIENAHAQQEVSAHRWPTPVSELLDQARLGILTKALSHWDISHAPQSGPLACDWISGAFFLIRHEVLACVGEMDENYFLYFEEVDYCRKAVKQGWQVWQAPASGIVHLEGASTGIRDARRPRATYWFDSRRRFLISAYGWRGLLAADVMSLVGRGFFMLRKVLRLGAATRTDETPRRYHRMLIAGDIQAAWRMLTKNAAPTPIKSTEI